MTVILGSPDGTKTEFYTKAAVAGRTDIVQISSAKSPTIFCVDTEKKNGQVLGSTCTDNYSPEEFIFQCAYSSCTTSTTKGAVIGKKCQVVSTKFGQCVQAHGNNAIVTLGTCSASQPQQFFNIILA